MQTACSPKYELTMKLTVFGQVHAVVRHSLICDFRQNKIYVRYLCRHKEFLLTSTQAQTAGHTPNQGILFWLRMQLTCVDASSGKCICCKFQFLLTQACFQRKHQLHQKPISICCRKNLLFFLFLLGRCQNVAIQLFSRPAKRHQLCVGSCLLIWFFQFLLRDIFSEYSASQYATP